MKYFHMIGLCLLLVVIKAQAEVYKWIDKDGNVHYTDRSVKNSEEMNISTETEAKKSSAVDERKQRRQKLADALREDRKEKERLKKEEQKKKKKLKRQCQVAKDQLRNYKSAGGIYDLDKDGKRIMLSDKERSQFTNQLQSAIKKYCK